MADPDKRTDGPSVLASEAYDPTRLPDWDNDFVDDDDFLAFASALAAPEILTSPSEEDLLNPKTTNAEFITALNDWRPVYQRQVRRPGEGGESRRKTRKRKRQPFRGKDETREGWTYSFLKYPLLLLVCGWIIFLGACYILTRFYIHLYEQYITWRGLRDRLRKNLRVQDNYQDWIHAAERLDTHLENDKWKAQDEGSYYDWKTIRRIVRQLKKQRLQAEEEEKNVERRGREGAQRAIDDLQATVESCVKHNFAGSENPRLYSETYYGTKNLLQTYVDETTAALKFLFASDQLTHAEKRQLSKHLSANQGRTALCLSGGATFAYYHFGIAKALLDADLLPNIITGTSGGALVAALLATRTDDELKHLLVPALASRINACHEPLRVWLPRWWRTGARFDSVDWAKRCAWFCHGSLTFLEAYQHTGRVLNVSCVPSDPHSPTILANYLTAPDCVVWSAVLASAAVPGILNPVVLMRKTRSGKLEPYSFGHKWKDGSLRTDIPLKSLNLHFNVNFSIVSQVNPHVSLWFFSSRGTVGRPVTHRRGRGWRGGFLGSAIEQFIKLDLNKWLKVLRHLELLPRPLGHDLSEVFLQRFSGTITIWPKTRTEDFWNILSDPSMNRLAGMIRGGQLGAWPKLKFVSNRLAVEKVIEAAREATRPAEQPLPTPLPAAQERLRNVFSEENLRHLLAQARDNNGVVPIPDDLLTPNSELEQPVFRPLPQRHDSPSFGKRMSGWWESLQSPVTATRRPSANPVQSADAVRERSRLGTPAPDERRRSGVMDELVRQSRVFFDDYDTESPSDGELRQSETEDEGDVTDGGSESLNPEGS